MIQNEQRQTCRLLPFYCIKWFQKYFRALLGHFFNVSIKYYTLSVMNNILFSRVMAPVFLHESFNPYYSGWHQKFLRVLQAFHFFWVFFQILYTLYNSCVLLHCKPYTTQFLKFKHSRFQSSLVTASQLFSLPSPTKIFQFGEFPYAVFYFCAYITKCKFLVQTRAYARYLLLLCTFSMLISSFKGFHA